MKKSLLTAILAASALTAWSQTPVAPRLLDRTLPTATSRVMLAPAAPVNPLEGDEEPITTRPEGTVKLYSRGSQSYESMSGYIVEAADRGLAVEVVTSPDGKTVWMNNPVSKFKCNAWLKGDVEDDGTINFKLSQPVDIRTQNGQRVTYYATKMFYDPETEWFYATDNQDYKFKIEGNTITPLEPGYLLGLTVYTVNPGTTDYFYSWLGYGDYNISLKENHDVAVTAPEGLDMEIYGLIYVVDGHEINVGFDDEKNVWVQGMLRSLPYAWTKGTPAADGKYEFKSQQFLGIDPVTHHFTYFMGGRTERRFVEEYSQEVDVQVALPAYTATFDPEKKRFQFEDKENILITTNTTDDDGLAYIYLYKTPVLQYQDRHQGVPPKAPVFTGVLPYNPSTTYGGVCFDLPRVDTEDMLIEPAAIEYEMYVDGELFTFYPDEYRSLKKETTRISYYYSDGLDFMSQGVDHIVYFFFEGAESLGIRNIYKEAGKELYSEISTVKFEDSAVESVESAAATPVAEELYTLDGRRASANPAPGIYVVRTRYADGSVKTSKQIRK